jgi:hypothetical protein
MGYKYIVKRLGAPLTQAFGVLIPNFPAFHQPSETQLDSTHIMILINALEDFS